MTIQQRFARAPSYAVGRMAVALADGPLELAVVDDLEAHVDRTALLAGDDPAEPPYWAHPWSGSRVLADAVPEGSGRAVELGCGLALPGLVALRRGWRTTLVDRVREPFAFARASAAWNELPPPSCVVADVARGGLRAARFDLVLAAELLYDRAAFASLAEGIARLLAPAGTLLMSDAGRIDTHAFWPLLEAAGLRLDVCETRVLEEGFPVTVRLVRGQRL